MGTLTPGRLGYAIGLERHYALHATGEDSTTLLKRTLDSFPPFNAVADPATLITKDRILNQGNQGSCQGHALAEVFAILFWNVTARWERFSRAAAYYLSQRYDGISGDQGSTLSGGQKVATQHGMCLEKDWPYPSQYNPREPQGIKYEYKLKTSKPMKTVKEISDWADAGLPIETGIRWGNWMDKEIVTRANFSGGGGHATVLWQRRKSSGNFINLNSWGGEWAGDGFQEWTEAALADMLADPWSVFIGYAPDGMSFPEQEVIQ